MFFWAVHAGRCAPTSDVATHLGNIGAAIIDPTSYGITSPQECMSIACEPFETCVAMSYGAVGGGDYECSTYTICDPSKLVDLLDYVTIFGKLKNILLRDFNFWKLQNINE